MPDPAADAHDERELKQKIKGEVVAFLIKTAAEFATRHSSTTPKDAVLGVRLNGFHESKFDGIWPVCEYSNDGQPVFEKRSKRESFFLYYRGGGQRQWVIDTIITPSGAVFARNDSPGEGLDGEWVMRGDWIIDPKMEVKRKKHPNGYDGDAVEIAGAKGSLLLDGLYLRQPPYDDVHGHPHFIWEDPETATRRHLFKASPPQKDWQISPVCNDDEGCFAISQTCELDGDWTVEADDVREEGHSVTLLHVDQGGTREDIRKGLTAGAGGGVEEEDAGEDPLKRMIR